MRVSPRNNVRPLSGRPHDQTATPKYLHRPARSDVWSFRQLDARRVFAEGPGRNSAPCACIEYTLPDAVRGAENVTPGRKSGKPVGELRHQVLQRRVTGIVWADKTAAHRVAAEPEPLRVTIASQPGAIGRVAVRIRIGWIERDTEVPGQPVLQPPDIRHRLQDILIVNGESELGEVVGERVGHMGFAVAFDIGIGDHGGRGIFAVIEAEVPMPVTVEGTNP